MRIDGIEGIGEAHAAALSHAGVTHVRHLLQRAATRAGREALARRDGAQHRAAAGMAQPHRPDAHPRRRRRVLRPARGRRRRLARRARAAQPGAPRGAARRDERAAAARPPRPVRARRWQAGSPTRARCRACSPTDRATGAWHGRARLRRIRVPPRLGSRARAGARRRARRRRALRPADGRRAPGARGRVVRRVRVRLRHALQPRGPIHVEGAQPGDTLAVEILALEAGDWGWCSILPELGLLPDDFPEGFVRTFDLRGGSTTTLVPGVEIPITPFCGTMGTCPDRERRLRPVPAPRGRRQRRHPPPHGRARRSTSRCTCRARTSRSAIRTPPRATARSAWPRSSARCRRACASASRTAPPPAPGS